MTIRIGTDIAHHLAEIGAGRLPALTPEERAGCRQYGWGDEIDAQIERGKRCDGRPLLVVIYAWAPGHEAAVRARAGVLATSAAEARDAIPGARAAYLGAHGGEDVYLVCVSFEDWVRRVRGGDGAEDCYPAHVAACDRALAGDRVAIAQLVKAWGPPVLLLNTTIATSYPGSYTLSAPISPEEARREIEGANVISAIGHQATADAFSEILGRKVEMNRIPAAQMVGQIAIVLKIRGRLPEGVILSREQLDAIGYDLLTMTRTS